MVGSMDLLGLGISGSSSAQAQSEAPDHDPAPAASCATSAPSRSVAKDNVIAYPPAWASSAGAGYSGTDEMPLGSSASSATGSGGRVRQFTVRCEGRWRVRSSPSLNSKVIGSIANGTVVFGEDEVVQESVRESLDADALNMLRPEGTATEEESTSLTCLWVRVHRLEAKEAAGVSDMKRDTASGGVMYCLRRNALGYGLYEAGLEPLDGPLLLLSDALSADLRSDAQRANVERSEDVSLTWKILGAADSLSRFFTNSDIPNNAVNGSSSELRAPLKKRPEEVFEVKQRELLKKAARSLSYATTKVITMVGDRCSSQDDLTAILAKDVRGRYARLRAALAAAAARLPGTNESEPSPTAAAEQACEGSRSQLQSFAEHCSRLEKSGGWPELSHEVRQEIINFDRDHYSDLMPSTGAVNNFFASSGGKPTSSPSSPVNAGAANSQNNAAAATAEEPLLDILGSSSASANQSSLGSASSPSAKESPKPAGSFGGLCPLLPPPPPPRKSVGALIQM